MFKRTSYGLSRELIYDWLDKEMHVAVLKLRPAVDDKIVFGYVIGKFYDISIACRIRQYRVISSKGVCAFQDV